MTKEYRKFLEDEIRKADEAWKKAMAEGNFMEAAYVHAKRAADLEKILLYHAEH